MVCRTSRSGQDRLAFELYESLCRAGGLFIERPPAAARRSQVLISAYDVNPCAGRGWMDVRQLGNGLIVGRSSMELSAAREDGYDTTPDALGFGLLMQGCMELRQPQRSWSGTTREGMLMVRNGDIGRVSYAAPAGCVTCGISVDVPPALAEELRAEGAGPLASVCRGRCALWSIGTSDMAALHHIGQRMLAIDAERTALSALEFESLALDLLLKIMALRALGPRTSTARGARWRAALDDALDILHAEWAEPHTIVGLARRVGMNECYLKSLFRERTGQPIAAYLRRLRMQHARTLIESGQHTVQQVALQAGYTNPSHFSAAFRQVHGVLPSVLR